MPLINTNLEKEFNLTALESIGEIDESEEDENLEETPKELEGPTTLTHYKELDKIEAALPQVFGLDASDQEFDELAEYGLKAHKDLMELAMNVEQRFCGEVAGAAGNMLAHAITAKTNKAKKKLDMITLQLKKQLADHKAKEPAEPEVLEGESKMFNRNDILRELLKKPSENDEKS